MDKILEIENLRVSYHTYAGEVQSVRGVSFDVEEGEAVAIVGESGCGNRKIYYAPDKNSTRRNQRRKPDFIQRQRCSENGQKRVK